MPIAFSTQALADGMRSAETRRGATVTTTEEITGQNAAQSPRMFAREAVYPIVCCAAVLACLLLARPFADSGFNDDWSYSFVALKLAETGRLHYSGWGSPMLLFQSIWAAAWIKLFGFSFDLLRMVTVPFSLGFVLMIYALGRKVGLAVRPAAFGALVVGGSPLFLPLAASFMTEPYACFFSTLCVYAALCSAEARESVSATRWLWVLTASGLLGGSDRQTVWVAPLALIPYLFWSRRSDRRFSIHAAIAYGVSLFLVGILASRFTQPYAPLDLSRDQLVKLVWQHTPSGLVFLTGCILSGLLVSWPALFCYAPYWRHVGWLQVAACSVVCLAVTVFLILVFGPVGLVPFVGNILTPVGIVDLGKDALGFRPDIVAPLPRVFLTWGLALTLLLSGQAYGRLRCKIPRRALAIFTIFSGTYLPFLFPGALFGLTFDRYVLPVFPLAVILILSSLGTPLSSIPRSAWACLVLFSLYSVATTHDYYSALRARTLAAQRVEKSGISRTRISAGFEYDGWTQLQTAGRMKAAGNGDYPDANTTDRFWLWSYTTELRPEYVAAYHRGVDKVPGTFTSIPFTTWIPPFGRSVAIYPRDELERRTIDGSSRTHATGSTDRNRSTP